MCGLKERSEMVHFALLSLMNTLEQILRSDRFPIFHAKQEIVSLYRKSRFLETLLQDSPQKTSQDEVNWLEIRVRDVSLKAEDTIESHILDQILSDPDSFISPLDSFPEENSSNKNYQDLQEAINEIDSIVEELLEDICGLKHLLPRKYLPAGSSRPARDGKRVPVGLDEDVVEIKDRLTGQESKLCSIPIVGMGGIGKTTLARNLFDDSLVKYHFDVRAWVTISQRYLVHEVLMGLLQDIGVAIDQKQVKGSEDLKQILYQNLKGRRYLMVLDDIWSSEVWDDLKRIFPDDANGSRIMLTTRLMDVAAYATDFSNSPYQMLLLDEGKSWDLFCQEVFAEKVCPPELEQTGKMIVKNCRGLPLSIAVIGGLLAKADGAREYWEYVAENVNLIAMESDEHCAEILSLSYNNLSHHLKACFLYFGIFPEDHQISVSKLIKLWVAEGFLRTNGSKSLEEAAEESLKDLIDRNLVFVHTKGSNGKTRTCYVHDLLRDLCLKEAKSENFLQIMNRCVTFSDEVTNSQRRLIMHLNILKDDDITNEIYGSMESMPFTRSLLFTGRLQSTLPFYLCFGLLRVLDLDETEFSDFPMEILYLVNLRFVSFGFSSYPVLPSLFILWNLQTLIVKDSQNLLNKQMFPYYESYCQVELPPEILQMPQLRHLQMTECFLPYPIDRNNSVILKNMETVSMVANFRCTDEFLKKFPNLKKLGLYYYAASIEEWSEYNLKNLVRLSKLENLKCIFNWPPNSTLLSNLTFPENLKKLTLSGSKLHWKDITLLGLLPNLEVLKLREYAFMGAVWEPVEGEFCRLKFLLINRTNLVQWIAENLHFPRLEHLIISQCHNLEEIPSGIGEIATLQMIEIDDCSSSAVTSAEQILEEQKSLDNYDLQVLIHRFLS